MWNRSIPRPGLKDSPFQALTTPWTSRTCHPWCPRWISSTLPLSHTRTPYITPARCPGPTQVTRLDPQQPAWDQSHKRKVQLNFVWICIPHSILACAAEAYLFLSSLHANKFKRLQLKLFPVPTTLNFSTLSSFSCICCCFWSHTSSPLYLLSSIAREPFLLTPHFWALSPFLTVCQLRTSSSFPHWCANSWTTPRNTVPFPKRFRHHLPLPRAPLHLLSWLAIFPLLCGAVFTPPLHWAHAGSVLMAAIITGTNKPCNRHFICHMLFYLCSVYTVILSSSGLETCRALPKHPCQNNLWWIFQCHHLHWFPVVSSTRGV